MGFTVHECDLGGPFFDAENTQPGTQEMQIKVVLRQHSTALRWLQSDLTQ
jgi:hypothetical protein